MSFFLVLRTFATEVFVDIELICYGSPIFYVDVMLMEVIFYCSFRNTMFKEDLWFSADKLDARVTWRNLTSGDHVKFSGRDESDAGGYLEFFLHFLDTCTEAPTKGLLPLLRSHTKCFSIASI